MEQQKVSKAFWKERAQDVAPNNYIELLKSVMVTEDPLVALHRHFFEERFVALSLGIRPMDRILDLGCGFGRLTFVFAKLAYEVDGVDSCANYINIANQLKFQNKVENSHFFLAKADEFTPRPDGYDLIFMGGLFPYMRDDQDVFDLISKLKPFLRTGGKFVVREPAPVDNLRICRTVHTFRTVEELAGTFKLAGYQLQRLEEATAVGPIFYKLASTLFPNTYSRKDIDVAKTLEISRFQTHFNFVLRPMLRMKEMILGSKSDIKIYFHVYT